MPESVPLAKRTAYAASLSGKAPTGASPGVLFEIIGAPDALRFLLRRERPTGLAKLLQLFLGINIEQAAGVVDRDER